jgi:hypothetical protein
MARHNGQKVHEKLIELMRDGNPVTPGEISNVIGTRYYSQYIHKLTKLGYNIKVTKDGVKVLFYTLISSPKTAVVPEPQITQVIPSASVPRKAGADPFVENVQIIDRGWDTVPSDIKTLI